MDLAYQLHVRAGIGEQLDELHPRVGPRRPFAAAGRTAFSRAAATRAAPPSSAGKGKGVPTTTAANGHDDGAAAVRGGELRIRTVRQQQLHEFDVAGSAGGQERRHVTIGGATEARAPIELQ